MLYTLNVSEQVWINNLNFVAREGFQGCASDEPSGIGSHNNLDAMPGFCEQSNEGGRLIGRDTACNTNDYVSQLSFAV
jgi:hypothetical protein